MSEIEWHDGYTELPDKGEIVTLRYSEGFRDPDEGPDLGRWLVTGTYGGIVLWARELDKPDDEGYSFRSERIEWHR